MVNTMWNLIKENTKTILFTSHNWDKTKEIANKICFIYEGKIIQKPIKVNDLFNSFESKKKLIIEKNKSIKETLSKNDYYLEHNEMIILYKENTNLLEMISKKTTNYSISDINLKDIYIFKKQKLTC